MKIKKLKRLKRYEKKLQRKVELTIWSLSAVIGTVFEKSLGNYLIEVGNKRLDLHNRIKNAKTRYPKICPLLNIYYDF